MESKPLSVVPAIPVPPPRSSVLMPKIRLQRRTSASLPSPRNLTSKHNNDTSNADQKANDLDKSHPSLLTPIITTPSPATNTRTASTAIFPVRAHQKQEQDEYTIALQQNVIALTASNQREKRIHEVLKEQVESITEELNKLKELYKEEKLKNEKITAAMRKSTGALEGPSSGILPENGTSATTVAGDGIQQPSPMEITYQRKLLSLENRYKDIAENNRRLLKKIEQLEKIEADAEGTISQLREGNIQLATQVDTLTGTVSSQSSLIIGLRTTVQKLQQAEQDAQIVRKKLERTEMELETSRKREKKLRDDLDQTKQTMHKEKESLMNKIVEVQMRLKQAERVGDEFEALLEKLERMEMDKDNLENECLVLKTHNAALSNVEIRLQEQEMMMNRLRLTIDGLQLEKKQLVATIERQRDELTALKAHEKKSVGVELLERQVQNLMNRIVDLEGDNNSLEQANSKLQAELVTHKHTLVSHDGTVQALQLARQKVATHEGLALVNDEKIALEIRLQSLTESSNSEREKLNAVIKQYANEIESRTKENRELLTELTLVKARLHSAPPDNLPLRERDQVEAEVARLHVEYAELKESVQSVEKEYNVLVKKKYKNESFYSQAQLLQNENAELSARLETLLHEMERDRAELQARAVEIIELQARVMDPNVIEMLRKTQESLEKTVGTLVETEIASESTFTCLQCMRLFVNPMTLTPCGHTYCTSCLDKMGDVNNPSSIVCKECAGMDDTIEIKPIESVFPNQSLGDLTARFIFRQQTLSSLTTMCLSLRSSYATRSTITQS